MLIWIVRPKQPFPREDAHVRTSVSTGGSAAVAFYGKVICWFITQ